VKLEDLKAALTPMLGMKLAEDLVSDFLKIRQDHATGTLERASPGKFVETVVQCLQHVANGTHDAKPNVDAYLRDVESDTRLTEGLRLCSARVARSMYTLRNKRNVAHKADAIDPNLIDLAFAHHASSWIMSELLRSASSLSMDEAGKLIALVQTTVGSLVEDIDGTRIVLVDVPIKTELLILLHGRYPERVQKHEILDSLSRRVVDTVTKALRALVDAKQLHGNARDGYVLTQNGYRSAVIAMTALRSG